MPDPEHTDPELTRVLHGLARGDTSLEAEALERLAAELHAIAAGYVRTQREGHTLQATALVNEAFVKLFAGGGGTAIDDRKHFFRLAARAMRQVLVDHARRRQALKRGGAEGVRVTLNEELLGGDPRDEDLLDLDVALDELTTLDERQARVVELRFFVGLEVEEVAEVLGVSRSTVEREWRMARAWLGRRIAEDAL